MLRRMKAAAKISRIIDELGWSQSKLARVAGLKQRTVSYIVGGNREPSVTSAIAIAAALKVPVEWLWDASAEFPAPAQGAGGPPLQSVPEAAIVEEVLRRKRFAREAFETLLDRYMKFREFYRSLCSMPTEQLQSVKDESRRMWTEFEDARHSYFHTYRAWHDYEERWYQINFLGRLDEPDADEMFKTMVVLRGTGTPDQLLSSVKKVLRIWTGPRAPRESVDHVAQIIFDSQDRSFFVGSSEEVATANRTLANSSRRAKDLVKKKSLKRARSKK